MTRPEAPYPGIANPATFRAAAILPAAGVWDAAPAEVYVAGFENLTLYITYTRGGAAGAVNFRVDLSPYAVDVAGVEDWFQTPIYDPDALVAGADATSALQREDFTYTAIGATAETFVYTVPVAGAAERVRILCREIGNIGAPGDCHVVGVLW